MNHGIGDNNTVDETQHLDKKCKISGRKEGIKPLVTLMKTFKISYKNRYVVRV